MRPELVLQPTAEHPPGSSDEFYTLSKDFEPWNEEFAFTVDCCALNAEAAKLPRFYTPEQNGLKQNYANERVWMNPPFSDLPRWIDLADRWMGNWIEPAELWVSLLPQNRQEQPWWHIFVERYRDLPIGLERNEHGRIFSTRAGRAFTLETRNLLGRRRFGFPGSPDSPKGGKQPTTGHLLVIWRSIRR